MERMQRCTHNGGRFACAMPRGSGKTTLAEVETLRALLYGHRRFVVFIGATEKHAARALKRMQAELETNDLLLADFPEACYPVRRLERIHNRAKGQTLDGQPTRIEWTAEGLVLPTVPGAPCSGAAVQVAGLTGSVRGMNVLGPDGMPMRPDLVVIDDAQTRESAKSPTQTADREAIIADDILGLAGPTVSIAAFNLCTPIYVNDLAERFLSPEKHPEWQGVRTKMLASFPTKLDLWDTYADLRRNSFRDGTEGATANEFYEANRAEMDAGAVATWPERKKPDELSGIQSAMNLHLDNPRGFRAEYQCEPDAGDHAAGAKELSADVVAGKLSGIPRYEVPYETSRLVAFIDVGGSVLWYCVTAWDERFGGAVVDYGSWPRQNRSVFAANDARPSLADKYPGFNESQLVFAGLRDLTNDILSRVYYKSGTGGQHRIDRCLIDAGWNTAAVYQFCRQTEWKATVLPSKGVGRSTTALGVAKWKARPGERSGYHWRLTAGDDGKGRSVQFDPDAWKSFTHERLLTPPGGGGCLSLFGSSAAAHPMISEHCAAEYSEPITLRGDTFDKWLNRPDRPDNHLWDCLVGTAVAASVEGLTWHASGAPVVPKRPTMTAAELQKLKAKSAPVNRMGQ